MRKTLSYRFCARNAVRIRGGIPESDELDGSEKRDKRIVAGICLPPYEFDVSCDISDITRQLSSKMLRSAVEYALDVTSGGVVVE